MSLKEVILENLKDNYSIIGDIVKDSDWKTKSLKFLNTGIEFLELIDEEDFINENSNKKEASLIAGFPLIGRTYFANNEKYEELNILDINTINFKGSYDDEGKYEENSYYPENLIEYINDNIFNYDFILFQPDPVLIEELNARGIFHYLIYPNIEEKESYLERFESSIYGQDDNRMEILESGFTILINYFEKFKEDSFSIVIETNGNTYLSDIIEDLILVEEEVGNLFIEEEIENWLNNMEEEEF